jgi:hypothetical protein
LSKSPIYTYHFYFLQHLNYKFLFILHFSHFKPSKFNAKTHTTIHFFNHSQTLPKLYISLSTLSLQKQSLTDQKRDEKRDATKEEIESLRQANAEAMAQKKRDFEAGKSSLKEEGEQEAGKQLEGWFFEFWEIFVEI